jgi:hypothetical protein
MLLRCNVNITDASAWCAIPFAASTDDLERPMSCFELEKRRTSNNPLGNMPRSPVFRSVNQSDPDELPRESASEQSASGSRSDADSEETGYRYVNAEDDTRIYAGFGSRIDVTGDGGYRTAGPRDQARIQAGSENDGGDGSDSGFRYAESKDEVRIVAELKSESTAELSVVTEGIAHRDLPDSQVKDE